MPDVTGTALWAKARGVAGLIADRLADPQVVAASVATSQERSQYPFSWGGPSLYSGHAGTMLLFRTAARISSGDDADRWQTRCHEELVRAVRGTHDTPLTLSGVGDGTAGLALAVADSAADQPRYGRALRGLHGKLAEQVIEAPGWRRPGEVSDDDYDVVRGAAGVLGYLVSVPDPDVSVRRAVATIVDDLVWLCTPGPADDRPPWTIAPQHYPLPEYLERYPHGYVNLGLAHGVPGPLAALCQAWTAGHRTPDLLTAIRYGADYLVEVAAEDEWGRNWPAGVPLDPAGAEVRGRSARTHTAWCYGAPGVCSALLDAAAVLHDDRLHALAVESFEVALRRVREHPNGSATICHGLAGVLAISTKFARYTGSRAARSAVGELTEAVLAHCDPDLPLVVPAFEPPDIHLDSPGLLDGAAGVALVLWSVSTPTPTPWQRALLIS